MHDIIAVFVLGIYYPLGYGMANFDMILARLLGTSVQFLIKVAVRLRQECKDILVFTVKLYPIQ